MVSGDEETNPAYGKAAQFARESVWVTAGLRPLARSMIALFLRNMHLYLERRSEIFLPREWGGLGLPGVKANILFPLLPEWHQKLITARERGDMTACRALGAWSTSEITKRGFMEEPRDDLLEIISEYLPTVHIEQLELPVPSHARYRDRLKAAKLEGWVPLEPIMGQIRASSAYESVWDATRKPSRGFKTLSWAKRSAILEKVSQRYVSETVIEIPSSPSWQPGPLVLLDGVGGVYEVDSETVVQHSFGEDCSALEDGENVKLLVPIIGTMAAPRVFLHYDNNRLILNVNSRRRNSDNHDIVRLVPDKNIAVQVLPPRGYQM